MNYADANSYCATQAAMCPDANNIKLMDFDHMIDMDSAGGILIPGEKYLLNGAYSVTDTSVSWERSKTFHADLFFSFQYAEFDDTVISVYPGPTYTPDINGPYSSKTIEGKTLYFDQANMKIKGDGKASAKRLFFCQADLTP